ncbi:MAG: cell division protein FtsA [Chloroflexota bacterium]|nr:cell division protein FtsA [Chloroflexota bacterium]
MAVKYTVAAIDVGTTKICTLIGEVDEMDRLRIVGVGLVPSRGVRKGMVVNVAKASEAILESVERAERISGYTVERALVGVGGQHIQAINSQGVAAVSRSSRGVTLADVNRALEAARAVPLPHNRQIIHVIPRFYTLDGLRGIQDPLGLYGFRLEVDAHVVTGSSTAIRNLVKCVEEAGVEVAELILQPLAAAEAVLTDAEREMGVAVVDIGGGTTDIGIFIDSAICHTVILPTGGDHLTNDVAVGLRAPFASAEEVKIQYGHALPEALEEERIEIVPFGDGGRRSVSRRFLAQIVRVRTEEIFDLIQQEVKRSGYSELMPAGLVLCGGTGGLEGIEALGREVVQLPIRVGRAHDIHGLIDSIEGPAFATSVGLLMWGMHHPRMDVSESERPNTWQRIMQWLRAFLPG